MLDTGYFMPSSALSVTFLEAVLSVALLQTFNEAKLRPMKRNLNQKRTFLATEVTEDTEGNQIQINVFYYFSAFLRVLCVLCG